MSFYDAISFELGRSVARVIFAVAILGGIIVIGYPVLMFQEWRENRRGRS